MNLSSSEAEGPGSTLPLPQSGLHEAASSQEEQVCPNYLFSLAQWPFPPLFGRGPENDHIKG